MIALRHQPTRASLEGEIARIASSQYGVIARDQALQLGFTESAIKAALRSARWQRKHRGVYLVAGSPKTWNQDLMAVCLLGGEGTVASHRSAARLLGLAGFESEGTIEISSPRNFRRLRDLVAVHKVIQLPPCDVSVVRGIPTTDPARTLIDLASSTDEEALEIALDDALRRLISVPRLRWRIHTVGISGKRGAKRLSDLLQERQPGDRSPESPLETLFLRLLRRAGLPMPERQFEIRDAGKFVGRVDFAYPEHRLVIEVDGFASHSGRLDWENDRERRNWLEALGFRVLNVTKKQIRLGSATLIGRLEKILL